MSAARPSRLPPANAAEHARRREAYERGKANGTRTADIARELRIPESSFRKWVSEFIHGNIPGTRVPKPAPASLRALACKRCGEPFQSSGAGHRHCAPCRLWLNDNDGGYEPFGGGGTGRQVTARRA